jgi:adapter protein MecA 1/2
MRIEKLADNRIKVTLTTADLMHLDINIDQLTPNSKELHTFLFHLMETIREETDFNPYSGQVVVEATPSSDGISILISKMQMNEKGLTREQFRKISSIKPKIKQNKNPLEIYYFDDFGNLCDALVNLQSEALSASELYRNDDKYCILIEHEKKYEKSICVLREFATEKSRYPLQEAHIKEHWSLVAKGESLLNMVDGIVKLNEI